MAAKLRIFDSDDDGEPILSGSFETKVVGVSHTNSDGSHRQEVIRAHCKAGTQVILLPEPDNFVDASAIRVCLSVREVERQIGYLKADIAAIVADGIESNVYPYATVVTVVGGTRDRPTRGVILEIELRAEPDVSYDGWLKRQRQRAVRKTDAEDASEPDHTLASVAKTGSVSGQKSSSNRQMTRYKNRSGDSGVAAFQIGADFIKVRFLSQRRIYVYTRNSVGTKHLKEMKRLAKLGKGLSSYIIHYVHSRYERIE